MMFYRVSSTCLHLFLFGLLGSSAAQAIGQSPDLIWRDGVLYSRGELGEMNIVGSITGFLESKGPDGAVRRLKTVKIPSDFSPLPQDGESIENRELRSQIERAGRGFADWRRENPTFNLAVEADILSADGLVYLVYAFESARKILELSPSQANAIRELIKNYQRELEHDKRSLKQQLSQENRTEYEAKVERLRGSLTERFTDILLPHQIKTANLQSPNSIGILRILCKTPIGNAVPLTKEQKERVLARSAEVSRRLQMDIEKARQEVWSVLLEEITEDQLDQVREFYPGVLEHQINNSSLGQFLRIISMETNKTKADK